MYLLVNHEPIILGRVEIDSRATHATLRIVLANRNFYKGVDCISSIGNITMAELTDLDGVGESREDNLKKEGYESVESLTDADPSVLGEEVDYLPEDTALELIVQAQNIVAEEDAEIEESEPETITREEEADADEEEEVVEITDPESEEVDEELEELEEEIEEETSDSDDSSETDDSIEFSLTFDEKLEYDTFFDSVMGQRAKMLQSNRDGVDVFEHALDQMRLSSGVGATVELSMEEAELNNLHNCVRQTMIAYKGNNLIDHMDAIKSVLNDINEVRDEHLF